MTKTAVLVDGAFYRKRAKVYWKDKDPKERAEELRNYIFRHMGKTDGEIPRELYRIFYYDCPPVKKKVFHPALGRTVDFSKSVTYSWMNEFLDCLKKERKLALRLGRLSDNDVYYELHNDMVKKLMNGTVSVDQLGERDFSITFKQKEVDMKLGIDVASLAYEGIVDQIILISGDSDFVPAAKIARRKGIDFILDSMGRNISSSLSEHIDGLETFVNEKDPFKPKQHRRE